MDFKKYSELYHYGVLGMHWGIRRYQNPDGSLTAEGREKYGIEESRIGFGQKRDYKNDYVVDEQDVIDVGNAEKFWDFENYDSGYRMNCPNCSLSVELKKRGIDVVPKPDYDGQSLADILRTCKGEKTYSFEASNFSRSIKENAGGPGSHGYISGQYPNNGGGHIFNYTVLSDGSIQIEDAQIGRVMTLEEARTFYGFEYGWVINMSEAEIDMDRATKLKMVSAVGMKNKVNYLIYKQEHRSEIKKLFDSIKKNVKKFFKKFKK